LKKNESLVGKDAENRQTLQNAEKKKAESGRELPKIGYCLGLGAGKGYDMLKAGRAFLAA